MGNLCTCRGSLVFQCSAEAEASYTTLWHVRTEAENLPLVASNILEVEVLQGPSSSSSAADDDVNDATQYPSEIRCYKWVERRLYCGRPMRIKNTLTHVSTEPMLSATYNIHFVDGMPELEQGTEVVTIVVHPLSDTTSRIVFSVNFVSDGWYGCYMKLCGGYLQGCLQRYFQEELEEYAEAAAERERRTKNKGKEEDNEGISSEEGRTVENST